MTLPPADALPISPTAPPVTAVTDPTTPLPACPVLQTYYAISRAAIAAAPSPPKLVAWIQWWSNDTYANPCSGPGGAISINYPTYKAQLTAVRGQGRQERTGQAVVHVVLGSA